MKAIEINGQIKQYSKLPSSWGNVLGGFDLLSDGGLKTHGFYDVVIPDYDSRIQEIGDLYFDSTSETFTGDVLNLTWSETLSELKEQKINTLKFITNENLAKTDWYVIRKIERSIDIPQDIQDSRELIITEYNNQESEINALTKKADVITYEFR